MVGSWGVVPPNPCLLQPDIQPSVEVGSGSLWGNLWFSSDVHDGRTAMQAGHWEVLGVCLGRVGARNVKVQAPLVMSWKDGQCMGGDPSSVLDCVTPRLFQGLKRDHEPGSSGLPWSFAAPDHTLPGVSSPSYCGHWQSISHGHSGHL